MVNAWWIRVLVGSVLGFLSGLGVGGGSLLMLWLTLIAGTSQADARLMNLMFFVPCALIASLFRWKQSKPDWPLILWAVAGGLTAALAGSFLHSRLDLDWMKKALGILFLICGARELAYRERKFK